MIIKIDPFPAVRVNGKGGRFMPRAIQYHEKIKDLRKALMLNCKLESIIKKMIEGNYELTFIIKMPDSWSKKKKEEMLGKPHRQTPDLDNLFKAFTDTVFYEQEINDREINQINTKKIWGEEGEIIFESWFNL